MFVLYSPTGRPIVEPLYGQLSIGGNICTFDTEKVREEIEKLSDMFLVFALPNKYTYDLVDGLERVVAKIRLKNEADKRQEILDTSSIDVVRLLGDEAYRVGIAMKLSVTGTVRELSELLDMHPDTLQKRMNRHGIKRIVKHKQHGDDTNAQ